MLPLRCCLVEFIFILSRVLRAVKQDPRLFYGSIRFNLDPFSIHADDAIWSSLEKVALSRAEVCSSSGGGGFC